MRQFIFNFIKERLAFVRFALVGCINTVNYYLLYMLLIYLGISYLLSHTSAFVMSMVISFFLNCYFTYRVKPTWRKFLQFPLTNVANYAISTTSLFVFVSWMHISPSIAPIIASVLPIPVTYILSKWILVKDNRPRTTSGSTDSDRLF